MEDQSDEINSFQIGTGATNSVQFAEFGYVPTINAVGTTNGVWVWQTRPTVNGVPLTNMTYTVAGGTLANTIGGYSAAVGGAFSTPTRGDFLFLADGKILLRNAANNSFNLLAWGGSTAAFPGLGRTNGDLIVLGGDGTYAGTTNRLVAERFTVGNTASATCTNVYIASATLDFAAQTIGSLEDLPITVTGAADGDFVTVAPPVASVTGIIGTFTGYASNNTAYVRFVSTGTAQNPASGTYKVVVQKFL